MPAKKVEQNGKDWDGLPPSVLFSYTASIQVSVRKSPFYLLYVWDPRLLTALKIK